MQAKKSRSFTVGVNFRLSSYYSLLFTIKKYLLDERNFIPLIKLVLAGVSKDFIAQIWILFILGVFTNHVEKKSGLVDR